MIGMNLRYKRGKLVRESPRIGNASPAGLVPPALETEILGI